MRREDADRAFGDLVDLLDEDRALGAQRIDHEAVVHHLMADIHGGRQAVQRALDDFDRAVHAGAEAAGVGEQNLHQALARPLRTHSRSMSRISNAAPIEMAMSATLKAA